MKRGRAFGPVPCAFLSLSWVLLLAFAGLSPAAAQSTPALTGLTLSAGTLTPEFSPETTEYTATVPNATDSIYVTPTAPSDVALTVNDLSWSSGLGFSTYLYEGPNTVTVVASAGADQQTYTITITREAPPPIEVTSVTPTSGGAGTPLTITGTGFQSSDAYWVNVYYGSGQSNSFSPTVTSDTEITGTMPDLLDYTGPVSIEVVGLSSSDTLENAFTYTTSPFTFAPSGGALDNGTVGQPYSQTVSASGGSEPYTYAVTSGALPDGLDLDPATGEISGTPTADGPSTFTITATDDGGTTGWANYTITVFADLPPPTVTSVTPSSGVASTLITIAGTGFHDSNGQPRVYFLNFLYGEGESRSAVPTVNSDAEITAIMPDLDGYQGTVSLQLQTLNGDFTFDDVFTYTAPSALTLSPPTGSLAAAALGASYSQTVSASGGTGSYSFAVTAGTLPDGLDLDEETGTITGTPTTPGSSTFSITATDSNNETGLATYTLVVSGRTPPTISLVTPSSGSGETEITITGTGFFGDFGSRVAVISFVANGFTYSLPFNVLSDTEITATMPDVVGYAGPVTFDMTTSSDGQYSFPDAFTYIAPPAPPDLTVIAPPSGPTDGNALVSLSGTNFTGTTAVTFGGVPATTFTVKSDIEIEARTPAHAPGTVDVAVTNPDGTDTLASAYTFEASSERRLSGLSLSEGTLSPGFSSGTLTYVAQAPNGTDAITVTPTAVDDDATITVEGVPVASGTASADIPLVVGANTITIVVTAENGTSQRSYVVTVTRAASDNAALSSLVPSVGTLDPAFAAGTYAYALAVGNTVESMTITPTAADPTATITVEGTPVASGNASQPLPLGIGANPIEIIVTAADGTTSETYTVTVTRATSNNAVLSSLVPSAGTLDPAFSPSQFAYTVAIGDDVTEIRLTPVADHAGAKITVGGTPVASGSLSPPIDIVLNSTPIEVVVTAEDGTTNRTYTVTVERSIRPDPSEDPEVIGLLNSQAESAHRFAEAQTRNFGRRLEQLHNEGERRRNSMEVRVGFAASEPASAIDAMLDRTAGDGTARGAWDGVSGMLAYGPDGAGDRSPAASASDPAGGLDLGRYAVWSGGFVNFGSRNDGGLDLDHTMVGLSGGIDARFSDDFVFGIGLGYGRDKSEIGGNGTESRAEAYSAAFYGSYNPFERFFFDGLLGGSWLDFDSRRHVTQNGDLATGARDGSQLFGSVTAAYEFRDGASLVSPYGRVDFSRSWLEGFTEEGGGAYALSYGDQTVDSLSGVLGLRASYAIATDWGTLTPGIRAEYTHDFAGSSRIDLGYADLDDLAYALETEPTSRDYATLGLSLDAAFPEDWTAGLDYRTAFGDDRQDHSVGVEVRKGF